MEGLEGGGTDEITSMTQPMVWGTRIHSGYGCTYHSDHDMASTLIWEVKLGDIVARIVPAMVETLRLYNQCIWSSIGLLLTAEAPSTVLTLTVSSKILGILH